MSWMIHFYLDILSELSCWEMRAVRCDHPLDERDDPDDCTINSINYKVMLQKFFAAPVDRSFVFPSSALLSRLIVYSSSHLCSLFFILYSLLSSHVVCYLNGALLSAPSSLPSLPAFLFFFLFILILLSLHLMTHTFCFSFFSFVNSVRLLSSWFHTFILLTRTFILQKFFQSLFTGLYGALISFYSCPLHARYVYFSSFYHS